MRQPRDFVTQTNDPLQASTGSLSQLAKVTRRRWPFLILTVIVAVAVAIALSKRQQAKYEATSSVLLTQNNVGLEISGLAAADVTDPAALARLAQNAANVADNATLAAMAKRAAKLDISADDLRAETDISPSSEADVLNFTVTSSNPTLAVRASRAWAEQYLEYRQKTDLADVARARKQVRAQIRKIDGDPDQEELFNDLLVKDRQLESLQVLQTPNAQVFDLANGAVKTQPKTKRNALLALVVGLILGIILMFVREALDRRVRDPDEIESSLNAPFLGAVPGSDGLWTAGELSSAALDRLDVLRAEIAQQLPATDGAPVVAVTGIGDGHGRADLTTGLALAWARAGSQVVVLNFDSVGVAQTGSLGVAQTSGVMSFIAGDEPFASAVSWIGPGIAQSPGDGNVGVVSPVGATNGSMALGDGLLRRLVSEARAMADVVLVQTASLTDSGVAVTAAGLSDAAVVVVRRGEVTQDGLDELRRILARVLPTTLGFVLTDGGA